MLPSLLTFLRSNKTHVTYALIILIIGLVTNYLFNRVKAESLRADAYAKALMVAQNNVKIVTKTVTKEVPVLLPNGQVGTERVSTTDTVHEDLSRVTSNLENRTITLNTSTEGRSSILQVGIGPAISNVIDLGGFASARLYGPYGVFISGGSTGNFSGVCGYVGVTFNN